MSTRLLFIKKKFCYLFVLFGISCSKFDDRLAEQNNDSGIIKVVKNGLLITDAQIDEIVTVYAKIGAPATELKVYVSEVEAQIISSGKSFSNITPLIGEPVQLPMDTFNIIIPRAARIGAGSIYFSIDRQIKPALPFTVRRPDILIPNNVTVEPFTFIYGDSVLRQDGEYEYSFPEELRDGPMGMAVITSVRKLTYDRNSNTFYFLDYQKTDHSLRIRQMKNGYVTTIAGGGNDYFASTGAALKLGTENFNDGGAESLDMRPGPDGKLYFTNTFTTDADPVTGLTSRYSLIQRLDPGTGAVEIMLGNNRRSVDHYASATEFNYRGLEDGPKDSAMISSPEALTFDKKGDLYFLDSRTLLRKLTKDGGVETILGKINRDVSEFEDVDGKIYRVTFYSAIGEHSEGFGDEVRFNNVYSMVQAGNGKFYILSDGDSKWGKNIVEVNMDTKEASIVAGLPAGQLSVLTTGTFKEVQLPYTITTFDVDFDGNILFGFTSVYKMDLQSETIALVAGMTVPLPPGYSDRTYMKEAHPGNMSVLGRINRIVFDQFGNLYAGYDYTIPNVDVRIARIVIEK